MENKAPYAIVGFFVVVLIFGLTFFVLWLGRYTKDGDSLRYSVYFEGNVTGLKEGGSVLYQGVPVGHIEAISIENHAGKRIHTVVALAPDVVIKTDSVASVEMKGVTGGAFLQITGGSAEAKPIIGTKKAPYPEIQARTSSIEKLMIGAPQILDNITQLTASFNTLFNKETVSNIQGMAKNMHAFSDVLAEKKQDIGSSITEFRKFIHNANEAMAMVNKLSGSIQGMVNENRSAIRDFTNVGLYEFSETIAELQGLVRSLGQLTSRIESDPLVYLFADTNRGVRVKK